MLEDINNILNTGDVPNIYNDKDLDEISKECKKDCQRKGIVADNMNIY